MGGWEGEKEAFTVGGSDTGNGRRSTDWKTVPLLLPERRGEEEERGSLNMHLSLQMTSNL